MGKSIMELIAMLPEDEQEAALEGIDPDNLLWDWNVWARPEQLPPGIDDWNVWLILAGRGFGKSRMGAEWIREQAKYTTEGQRRFALVARTAADARDVLVEGESGIMNVTPPSERPLYEPSKRRLTWPNGNVASIFTADEPDGLRGPQFRLDIATPVPTPNGWTTMGDLKVGDVVFDELGKPCNVTAVHEIELSLDSYRLNFSNGTHIDADGKHRWKVLTQNDLGYVRKHFKKVIPETWATERFGRESTNHQVKDTNQLRANTGRRLYIPATKAVEYAATTEPLPIDPWVLGLVLGDGGSAQPSYIGTHMDDKPWLLEELERSGLVSRNMNKDHVWAAGLIGPWRELVLYKNKHVPDRYLRASAEDRLALLQGLTDSDGGVEPSGAFRFTNTNKSLIDGYVELARSLGLVPKTYARKRRSRRGIQLDKQSWYVQVNSPIPLVRNPRKLAKARYEWQHQATQHSIVSIDPTTPKFMRCITVDSASHLYLAGEGMIPTSNSHAWADEIAAWRQTPDSAGMTAFDNLRVGTRLGKHPKIVATTTPKRTALLYKLIEESRTDRETAAKVVVTKGSTMDNAGNLSGAYLETILGVYEGTSLARQELYGEMLDNLEGAMWNEELVEAARHTNYPASTPLRVIGVDPSVAENPRDECGIVVCASSGEGDLYKRNAWVLEDASIHGSPDTWARKVVEMARKWGCPVVAEVNQGGALVRNAINSIDPSVKVLEVHSKYGKQLRAEPILLAYEQGRVHHVNYLPELESQMYSWIPGEGKSPDRVDAMVHAMTALLIKPPPGFSGGKLRAKSLADRKMGVSRPNTGNVGRVFKVR
jgi:phage terminase large subunit-like protein